MWWPVLSVGMRTRGAPATRVDSWCRLRIICACRRSYEIVDSERVGFVTSNGRGGAWGESLWCE